MATTKRTAPSPGTVTTVDADAGTFTLQPKDGSATIDYTINDETVITISRTGDLGQLNTTDPTMVMDVDGEVKWIRQGNPAMRFDRGPRAFPGFSGTYRQFRTGPEVYIRRVHDDEDVMELLPRELREKINSMRSGGGGGFNLPGNSQDASRRLRRHLLGPQPKVQANPMRGTVGAPR